MAKVRYSFERPSFPSALVRRARYRWLPSFALRVLRVLPHVAVWYVARKNSARDRIRAAFSVQPEANIGALRFEKLPRSEPKPVPLTIILPVFNAFDLLKESLVRVTNNTDCPWHLIIVEDCSTDRRVRPYLRKWRSDHNRAFPAQITLIENPSNLGFIRSVNRALVLARKRGHHVVLLNSDALVPQGWASRLLAPIVADDSVASVTPLSNDAEIFSVPVMCQKAVLAPGQCDEIDAVARRLPIGSKGSDAPTGVGFCMALNQKFLEKLPQLDPSFGRGYGEEVDWCQKARALGGRHLVQPRLFVEHRGGSSFGADAKSTLITRNNARISVRYPNYNSDVQAYIRDDPLRTARLALGLAYVAQAMKGEVALYLAHCWGGGAEYYLQNRISADCAEKGGAIVLRVGGPRRWHLELHTPLGLTHGGCEDVEIIEQLLSTVEKLRVIYSCAVGDPRPHEIPDVLVRLARGRPIDVLFHDYFPLSPSYHLLDQSSEFHGIPDTSSEDQAHQFSSMGGQNAVPLRGWRAEWDKLLLQSDRCVAFSNASADLIGKAVPHLASKIVVQPHQLHHPIPSLRFSGGAGKSIGILGNINAHKGAQIVTDLARKRRETGQGPVVLIGELDPAYTSPSGLVVHGRYALSEMEALVKRYGIGAWVIPSIWPETFSYTTHEALATGLPVFVFDLGAQAEAAARASNGQVVPFGPSERRADDLFDAILAAHVLRGKAVA
ncbi:glycosyltransferase [Litoreibacter janthinus]|nr:glycosyltransferase [Litoreibacter janthinus]